GQVPAAADQEGHGRSQRPPASPRRVGAIVDRDVRLFGPRLRSRGPVRRHFGPEVGRDHTIETTTLLGLSVRGSGVCAHGIAVVPCAVSLSARRCRARLRRMWTAVALIPNKSAICPASYSRAYRSVNNSRSLGGNSSNV